ncbi:unnamed protein product [Camellia sinensis]
MPALTVVPVPTTHVARSTHRVWSPTPLRHHRCVRTRSSNAAFGLDRPTPTMHIALSTRRVCGPA